MESELLIAAVTPMIESLVKELFVPKLKAFLTSVQIMSKRVLNLNEGYFNDYLIRMYDKYSTISTLVIRNSQLLLKDIYVAQSLVKETNYMGQPKEIIKIDKLPVELIKKYKRILITDTAGMGKSTIMKRMFIDLIDKGLKDVGIPIYVELNRLNKDRSLINVIQEDLNSLSKEFDSKLLLSFIQTGGFIFFLDGYDEISIADNKIVNEDIRNFISKAGVNNYYILASRPEDDIASFGSFQSFKIQPLTKNEAYELLGKYDLSSNKEKSKRLIDLLKSGQYRSIDEYLENPLLVSLLYTAFDYKQIIPLKKHLFYRQVYDALFESHELVLGHNPHEKHSGLDIDDFSRVLRRVGYDCLIRIGVQFDKDTILQSIRTAKSFCANLDFGENKFLKDLTIAVPLFAKDGTDYKWTHKSLMEYFAARFIADDTKENQDMILTKIYKSGHIDKYINMLDLYYDIDYKGFSKNITLPLCERFLRFRRDRIKEIDYNRFIYRYHISKELIEERIGLLFMAQWAFSWRFEKNSYLDDDHYQKEQFQKHLGDDARIWGRIPYEDKFLWIATKIDDMVPLVELLRYKQHDLFVIKQNSSCNLLSVAMAIDIRNCKQNEVRRVNLHSGLINRKWFKTINNLLMEQPKLNFFLCYSSCEKEVKRIKTELIKNADGSDLLLGI